MNMRENKVNNAVNSLILIFIFTTLNSCTQTFAQNIFVDIKTKFPPNSPPLFAHCYVSSITSSMVDKGLQKIIGEYRYDLGAFLPEITSFCFFQWNGKDQFVTIAGRYTSCNGRGSTCPWLVTADGFFFVTPGGLQKKYGW